MSKPVEPVAAWSATEPLIRARGISKGYPSGDRRLEVLVKLEFEAAKGELIAIVGASGVGKSTLLHILGGIDRPDAGSVEYRGRDLVGLDEIGLARFRNEQIGFVFQFHYLLPEFTALENVMMPRLLRRESRRSAEAVGARLLDEMGIADRAHHRPGQLSGGEQQRVAIARSLAAEPELLLADEPTGNLDAATGQQVFAALAERVRERGVTAVIATHNLALAEQCGRILTVTDGAVVAL